MKLKFTLILSIVICTNAFSQCIQADYPFSGNANDVSGNNLNANTLNGVTLTSDRFGNANSAYQFDGIDDRIDLLDDFDFPLRTWSLWFYADTILQTPNVIMDNDHNNIQFGQTEISLTEIGGIKNLALLIGANAIFIPVNEKEWYHVAG
jgi:hypothetical protein